MTNNIAKIRAALEYAKSCELGLHVKCNEALAALAELEKAAAPQFVAAEVTDEACGRVSVATCGGGEPCRASRDWALRWLEAWRSELGPALGLVTREEMAAQVEAAFKSGLERFAPFYRSDAEVHSAWLESSARKRLEAK